MTIGDRIRELRQAQGLSQVDLADAIGETKQTIYKYETGIVTNIPLPKVSALAKALHTSPGYLCGWEEEEKPTVSRELTPEEVQVIDLIRQLPADKAQLILDLLHQLL